MARFKLIVSPAIVVLLMVVVLLTGHSKGLAEVLSDKITFDISKISPEGLIGNPDGLTSVDYEFCIPANESSIAEVFAIDPTIKYYPHSPGRINCKSHQYLCIANTHNPRWKEILRAIASLDYVERIDRFYAE
jgi:hypothetical protein